MVICHTSISIFLHLFPPGRVCRPSLAGVWSSASEGRGAISSQTAEEGHERQLHKIIGALCNLYRPYILRRLPSCMDSTLANFCFVAPAHFLSGLLEFATGDREKSFCCRLNFHGALCLLTIASLSCPPAGFLVCSIFIDLYLRTLLF